MKQIVDKLNKIALAIDENVEVPTSDLIIDSLDAITTAFGGTPNDSNLIVDKLEDIAGVAHSGITPTGNIEITENTAEGVPLDIAQYATATVNVAGGDSVSTATIALTHSAGVNNIVLSAPYVDTENNYIALSLGLNAGNTKTVDYLYVTGYAGGLEIVADNPIHLEVTGDLTVNDNDTTEPYVEYEGDGTIVFTMAVN